MIYNIYIYIIIYDNIYNIYIYTFFYKQLVYKQLLFGWLIATQLSGINPFSSFH